MVAATIQKAEKQKAKRDAKKARKLGKTDSNVSRPENEEDMEISSLDGDPGATEPDPAQIIPTPVGDDGGQAKRSRTDGALDSGGASSGSLPPASDGAAPVIDKFQIIMDGIANLTMAMNATHARFDLTETKISSLDRKVEQLQIETNARFAALAAAAPVAPAPGGPPRAWVKVGSNYAPAAAAPIAPVVHAAAPAAAAVAAGGRAPATSSTTPEFGRKVIVLGFPRLLPRPALVAWWETARIQISHDIQIKGTFQGGAGKTFTVVFPTRSDARAFTTHISTNQTKFQWTSPRPGEGDFAINFRTERTVLEQERGQALSGAWKLLSKLVRESTAFTVGMKFTTDTRRGFIAVTTDGGTDMFVLLNLKATGGSYSITTVDESFAHFGLTLDLAEAVRASVSSVSSVSSAPAAL
jgi:hypothetical protein